MWRRLLFPLAVALLVTTPLASGGIATHPGGAPGAQYGDRWDRSGTGDGLGITAIPVQGPTAGARSSGSDRHGSGSNLAHAGNGVRDQAIPLTGTGGFKARSLHRSHTAVPSLHARPPPSHMRPI